jgi:hypothetical protein
MRYVNLMGEKKPHLLEKVINNLGAETLIEYASSIKFYLQDKQAGKPWITRLPFPVHCVEKVTIKDKRRSTSFSTSYSYHHGYFDGIEREFPVASDVSNRSILKTTARLSRAMRAVPLSRLTRVSTSLLLKPSPGITPAHFSIAGASCPSSSTSISPAGSRTSCLTR